MKIRNMHTNAGTAVSNGYGFWIDGSRSVLDRVSANDFNSAGILLNGNGNKVTRSKVTNGNRGLQLGNKATGTNRFIDNFVSGSAKGIEAFAPGGVFKKNVVINSDSLGLRLPVGAQPAKVIKNTVLGTSSGDDLQDDAADCANNVWKSNTFGSANESCIE